jgi:cytidine deaminase
VTENGGTPCGACRQVIWDLCGDVPVHVANTSGQTATYRMKDLLPEAFDKSKLT